MDWIILQTTPACTLNLAKSLTDVGFEAWTPVTREVRRQTEQRSREEVAVPLVTSYVFAKADRLHDLLALSRSPSLAYRVWNPELNRHVVRGHPFFRLFRGGNHRFVPDRELEPLRRMERLPRPQRVERTFYVGQQVRTDDGGFAGLCGSVVAIRGKRVWVNFAKWSIEPEFPTWALKPIDENGEVHVRHHQPERDAA